MSRKKGALGDPGRISGSSPKKEDGATGWGASILVKPVFTDTEIQESEELDLGLELGPIESIEIYRRKPFVERSTALDRLRNTVLVILGGLLVLGFLALCVLAVVGALRGQPDTGSVIADLLKTVLGMLAFVVGFAFGTSHKPKASSSK